MKRLTTILLLLLAGACGDSSADTESSTGDATSSTTPVAEPCTPGESIACACTDGGEGAQVCADDGLSLGECVCEPGGSTTGETETGVDTESMTDDTTSETGDAECGRVVAGNVTVTNDLELDDMAGVVEVTGALSVAGVAVDERLACLRRVGEKFSVTSVGEGWNLLDGLERVGSLSLTNLEGPPAPVPDFESLEIVGPAPSLSIRNASGGSFPHVDYLLGLTLEDVVGCPVLADGAEVTVVQMSKVAAASCLEGSLLSDVSVVDGALPSGVIAGSLHVSGQSINSLQGLTLASSLTQGLSETLRVEDTSLTDLSGLEGVTEYASTIILKDNADLAEITQLTGASTGGSLVVENSPMCQSHFDAVAATMTIEKQVAGVGLLDC